MTRSHQSELAQAVWFSPVPAAIALVGTVLLLWLSLVGLASPALAAPVHPALPSETITGLNHACGAATDSVGDVYAASAGESRINIYDPGHNLLKSISNANEPCGLAVDSKGRLYVSEKATGNVVRYTPDAYPLSATPVYGAS